MHLLFWACCFIFSYTLPTLRVCALPTEHGATSLGDVSVVPLHSRALDISFANIYQVFHHALGDENGRQRTLLDPEYNSVDITMRSGTFDTNSRSMAIYNRFKATVIFMITARGVIFITIPRKLLRDISDKDNTATYDSHIKKPIITKLKALITMWSGVRVKTSIEKWAFPDALKIFTVTEQLQRPSKTEGAKTIPTFQEEVQDLQDDIYEFWTEQFYPNRDKVETKHSIQNVLGERTTGTFTDRFVEVFFPAGGADLETIQRPPFTPSNTHQLHHHGIAITWEPVPQVNTDGTEATIVHYKIWIGSKSPTRPFDDEKLLKQDLGWYPDGIEPLFPKGPNVGCAVKKPAGGNSESESALDPLNELRTHSGCNSIQENCAGKVLGEVRADYQCAPAWDSCGPLDTDSLFKELEMGMEVDSESDPKLVQELKKLQDAFVCVPKTGSHQRYTCPLEPIAEVLRLAKCIPAKGSCLLDHLFLTLELCDTEVALMDSMDTSTG